MSEPIQQIVGQNVRLLREERGLNKTTYCLMTGISRPYLNQIESGKANISVKMMEQIAASFDVPPAYLLQERESD